MEILPLGVMVVCCNCLDTSSFMLIQLTAFNIHSTECACLRSFSWFLFRIVEKGYYSERDAADAVKQILEAVAVSMK